MCEAGNKCVNGAKTACGGANEWQELPEKSVCDTVEDGKKKVSGKNDKIEDCGYGYYCKNGVSTACPAGTKPLPGSAETTLAPTKSLITDCAQTGVGCTPDGGGIGEQLCYWKPSDSAYNTCETCNLIGCPPGEHQVGMSCKSNIQPCTNSEVGLNSAGGMTVSGNAKYVSDGVWDVSQCYATGLPHGGTGFHGTGTKACYWTSGLGDAGVAKFESSCNNYNLTSCDGGYYRDVANASSCVPAGIGYYSPNTSISRTRCQDSGTTATDTEDSQNKCYKENLPFDGTHCDGRQTCWLGSSGSEYKTNCQVTAITSCDAGYYYYNDGTGSAPHGTIAPKGFYSPDGAISAIACSGGGDTDGTGSTSVNACFKKCSAPALPANADAISPVNGKEYYSGAGYPACTYNVVCKPGFTAADNHTTSPSCVRNTITVYYDPNGGTEAMNPQNCPFGDDCYAVDNAFRRAGYVFVKWCTTASGGGICINQNGNIGSFVNGIVTLYAQWAPCNNGMYSDNNNSSGLVCRYCPKGTYAPAGATAYASCLNAGVGYRTSNCANSDWTGCRERVQCEIGTYSDIENAAAICTLCPAGKYCPTAGAGSVGALPNCGAGYYCPIGSINGKGWDGYDNDDKLCAAGYYCPAGSDTATEIICPVGSFCPEGSGQPTPCPSNNYCVQTKLAEAVCNPGYALNVSIGGVRTCDIIAGPCPIDNGVGERNVVTGICEVVSCNAGYSKSSDGLACKSKTSCQRGQGWNGTSCVPCSLPGALDYSLAANGECVIAACAAGHHLDKDKNECAPNTRECSIEKGEGVQSWTNKSWGGCVVSDCDSDYHIENNMCVENTLPCAIDNGRGVKKWIGSAANGHWSDCEAELCNAGYTSDRALTNDWTVPCGRCNNYYGYDGSPAVGSYSSECNIAVCLYQGEKYVLEGDECVPICENREDDTGIMKFNSGTNKCERNCEDGYVSW
jgi:uncharacterized repeat protein (TIGR02543 family)